MKVKRLRVFQSVKVGKAEKTFLTEDEFDIELKDTLMFITSKSDKSQVITPLTNVPWFVPMSDSPRKTKGKPSGSKESKKNPSRNRPKTTPEA
jgi:hypothetical protein